MVDRFVWQRFGVCLLLIPILTGLFWILMAAVMALPDGPIKEHILEDAALLAGAGVFADDIAVGARTGHGAIHRLWLRFHWLHTHCCI